MMNTNATTNNTPTIGMGGTIIMYSDRVPITVIQITHNGKRLIIKEDIAIRTDNNGISDSQSYTYEQDPNGSEHLVTLRKDGCYRLAGSKTLVKLGERRKYHDYSF